MLVGGALAGLGGHGRGGRHRSAGCGPSCSPGTASSASSPRGSPATTRSSASSRRCVLGAIAVGGSGLKITAGLSGGAVNILMALVLLAVLGWVGPRRRSPDDRTSPHRCRRRRHVASCSPASARSFRALGRDQPRHRGLDARAVRSPPTSSASRRGNPWLGVARRCGSPAPLLAVVHALMVLHARRQPDRHRASSSTFLGIGITALFGQDYVGQGVVPLETWDDPRSVRPAVRRPDPVPARPADLPLVPRRAPLTWWVLFRTRAGLILRAAGERPEVLEIYGTSATKVRCIAAIARRGDGRHRWRPAVDGLHPQLVRADDRRPRLRGRRPRDLRRLGARQAACSAPTCSAAPSPCSLYLQAAGLGHLPVPARGPAVPRRCSWCWRCSSRRRIHGGPAALEPSVLTSSRPAAVHRT